MGYREAQTFQSLGCASEVFLQKSKKRRRRSHPFLETCSCTFSTHVKISDQSHSRSGHQLTSSGLTSESLNAHHSYTDWRTLWNFQRLIRITISTKCLSRNFDIDDLRSGQLCDLSITYMYISQVDKNERRLFRTETIINTLKYSIVGNIDTRNRTIAPSDLSFLSPMSSQVMKCWQKFFSAITLYIDLLERVEHLRGVQVDMQID